MCHKVLLLVVMFQFVVCLVHGVELAEEFVTEPTFGTRVRILETDRDRPLTVLLVHGVGPEGADIWRDIIPELARDYHVVACDLPGFGQSDKPNTLYTPERYDKFLAWLVKRKVPEHYILAGHSLGGALALHYAATAPVTPDKLILIDAAGILHRAALTKFLLHLKITEDKPYVPAAPLGWLDRLAGTVVEKLQALPVDLDLMLNSATLRETILGSEPGKIAGLALIETNFTSVIEQVEIPTFLIWGEDDDIAPLRTGRLLAARLKRAQLDLIAGGGHVPMRRQKGAFQQSFRRALQTTPVALPPLDDTKTDRVGRCREQQGASFSGEYRSIELVHCQNVQLNDVVTQDLRVEDSDVKINRTRIDGIGVGLHAVRSRIVATALDIESDLPIRTDQSSFDMAGVTLRGRGKHLVIGEGNPSRLLFSVSRGLTSQRNERLHGVIAVSVRQPF